MADCQFAFLNTTDETNVNGILTNSISRPLYVIGAAIYTTRSAAKSSNVSKRILVMQNTAGAKVVKFIKEDNNLLAKVVCGSKDGYCYIGRLTGSSTIRHTYIEERTGIKIAYMTAAGAPSAPNIKTNGGVDGYTINCGYTLNSSQNRYTDFNKDLYDDATTDGNASDSITVEDAYLSSDYTGVDGSVDGDDVTYQFSLDGGSFVYNISDFLYNETSIVNEDGEVVKTYTGATKVFEQTGKNIESNGLNYTQFRTLFGAPYQFLPTTDCRIVDGKFCNDNPELAGYEFANKILSRMPLLYITPGNTSFMGSSSKKARESLIKNFITALKGEDVESSLGAMLDDYTGKLYTIFPAFNEYFQYVNAMTRAGAVMLELTEKDENGNYKYSLNGVSLDEYHWGINEGQSYEIYTDDKTLGTDDTEEQAEEGATSTETNAAEQEQTLKEKVDAYDYSAEESLYSNMEKNKTSAKNEINQYLGALYYSNSIAFYINSETAFQESFNNETTDSMLATTINSLSDRAREVQFLLGTASSAVGEAFEKIDGTLSNIKEQINNIVSKVAGGNSIFTTIANSVKTIVSGGRMQFPQIWSNSTFSKSYNITIKLITPGTDNFSWWLDIYVPLCHLMALVLPRSEYVNSYTTPFLIKAFYKGMFNIDMGIITEMSFNRGKEGSWTKDGLPTVVEVSFTIQDLYSSMGMTSFGKMFKGKTLQNVAEMDYLANLCGININEPDIFRMVKFWAMFNITGKLHDFIPNLKLNVGTFIKTSVTTALNNLWT